MREFITDLQNFKFQDNGAEVYANALKFAKFISKNKISEIEIYLSDTFDFCVAFFGSMMAGISPDVLPKPIFSGSGMVVTDENFSSYMKESEISEIKLGKNSKFFLKTSGSSGESKRIEKRLESMVTEARYLVLNLGFDEKNIFFSSVSHQHMFGLAYKVFLPMAAKAKVISRDLNYPEIILDLDLQKHVFITSPVLLQALIQNPRARNLNGVEAIVSAGSELKNDFRKELEKLCDARIIDIYGSTETGTVAKNLGDGLRLLDAVKAGFDEREALNISSPWCELFQSNDWAEIDGDRLVLKGRIDRIVKLNDKRVSLESIEKKLFESGILSDCYCSLHPKFKRIAALLALNDDGARKFRREGKKGVTAMLLNILKKEFKNSVRYFKIVESLPRNQQGKFAKQDFESVLFRRISPRWSYETTKEGKHKFSSVMSVELEIFTYHFPNLPLIPGFMQLDFVFELAESIGINLNRASRIENLKFTKFVRPNDTLEITIEPKETKIEFEIFCNGEKCSSGRVIY